MPRKPDDARRANARRLYTLGISSAEIAGVLGTDRRTVQRWCSDIIRPVGPVPISAVQSERIVELRDRDGLSYTEIAALTALSASGAKNRYRKAKGLPRYPSQRKPGATPGEDASD